MNPIESTLNGIIEILQKPFNERAATTTDEFRNRLCHAVGAAQAMAKIALIELKYPRAGNGDLQVGTPEHHRCASPNCPGLPYRASDIAHPCRG